ncbi:MAG TPA: DMT family transporter, partial [bacterium]|nr:DMT family transporter [bacterium]
MNKDLVFKGYFSILVGSLLFALSTVFAKYAVDMQTGINGAELSFFRYALGLVIVIFCRVFLKYKINPVNKKGLYLRAILNAAAVILFFFSVQYSTVTNANILNMSYPIFVAVSSTRVLNEKITLKIGICLILSLIGSFIIISPAEFDVKANYGDVFGFLSAIIGGLAITDLKYIRKTDDTFTILYYLFFYGTIITAVAAAPDFVIPDKITFLYVLFSALTAIGGQFVLTFGQKYCSATKGSIISMS